MLWEVQCDLLIASKRQYPWQGHLTEEPALSVPPPQPWFRRLLRGQLQALAMLGPIVSAVLPHDRPPPFLASSTHSHL